MYQSFVACFLSSSVIRSREKEDSAFAYRFTASVSTLARGALAARKADWVKSSGRLLEGNLEMCRPGGARPAY